jgi:hypothetical protein
MRTMLSLPVLRQCPKPVEGLDDHLAGRPCTLCGHSLVDVRALDDAEATLLLTDPDRATCAIYTHAQAGRLGLLHRGRGWLAAAALAGAVLPGAVQAQEDRTAASQPAAQDTARLLRGVVRDPAGAPIGGVLIYVGERARAVTGQHGTFQLRLREDAETVRLRFARIGFERRELVVGPTAAPLAIEISPALVVVGIVVSPIMEPPPQSRVEIERILRYPRMYLRP